MLTQQRHVSISILLLQRVLLLLLHDVELLQLL
jgi:hypothetical protein